MYLLLLSFACYLFLSFVISTDLMLLKLSYFIATMSTWLSVSSYELCQLSSSLCCMSYIYFAHGVCTVCLPGFSALLHMPLK